MNEEHIANFFGVPATGPLDPIYHEVYRDLAGQPTAGPSPTGDSSRTIWREAARYYWASAYAAMQRRDFRAMRALAKQATDAEAAGSADGALFAAIFGERATPDGIMIAAQKIASVPTEQTDSARAAVLTEMRSHDNKPAPAVAAPKRTPPKTDDERAVIEALKSGPKTMAELRAMGFDEFLVRSMALDRMIYLTRHGNYVA